MKLKESILNSVIYLPIERRDVVAKFIDPRLYPYLYSKYPDLFEVEVKPKKNSKNDLPFDNTINQGDDNLSSKQTES